MLTGSMDTSSAIIEWHSQSFSDTPRVLRKLQQGFMRVVGGDRMVEESDLRNVGCLDIVIKETLRLHPVAPLLGPHEATEDCTIEDFDVPKGCGIIINAWAIGRDPTVWNNAEEFYPERFAGSNVDVKGLHFQLIPFGSGSRSCPWMHLGLMVFRLVLAQLVHCFDWELPNGMSPSDLVMSEKFSIVVPRAHHLLALPSYRLHHI
ncbi:cytochrome P450 CYP736A12-like protein [Cinnamomum micranthum f. kanehirae]|uniref:Cytochrome P450 CYP736A12-like protein n=1 Tax=Cinnamomum micranthum f. kanehirae TaxID=337451 RepID=A0A443NZG8_9MAGN|nr:cytochrome P450 CYP736A12-like protein [Cinnamomum micranthum f. kanehirae]